jgi:hypothetical protein
MAAVFAGPSLVVVAVGHVCTIDRVTPVSRHGDRLLLQSSLALRRIGS